MIAKYLLCGTLFILLSQVSLSHAGKGDVPSNCRERFIELSYALGNISTAYEKIRKLSDDDIKICDKSQNFTSCISYTGVEVVFKGEDLFKSNRRLTEELALKISAAMHCVSMPELLGTPPLPDGLSHQHEVREETDCRSAFVEMRDAFADYSQAYRGVKASTDSLIKLCDTWDGYLGCTRLNAQRVVYRLEDTLDSTDRFTREIKAAWSPAIRCVKIPGVHREDKPVHY